ncbi:MAG: hypothetical protein NVS2B7_23550 [Herpetosiphon sp.]
MLQGNEVQEEFLHGLLTLPSVMGARLSPDRRTVAFGWYRRHQHLDVFAVPAEGGREPVALTNTNQATRLVSWTPDSRAVLVAEDHDGDERVRLFRVRLDRPGAMEPLTEDRPPYFVRGGQLHPAGQYLFYGMNYDVERGVAIEQSWLYRHDLQNGERQPLARPRGSGVSIPLLNETGSHLLYARRDRHPAGLQYWLVDIDGHEDREILNFGDQVKVAAQWLPNGEEILFVTDGRDGRMQGYKSVGLYQWRSGNVRWLVDDAGRSIESVWAEPGGWIVVDEVRAARHTAWAVDPGTGEEVRFHSGAGNRVPLGRAANGSWVALRYGATAPAEVVLLEQGTDAHAYRSLSSVWQHTSIRQSDLADAEDVRWRSGDGLEVQGWLYRSPSERKRAVILVHGGPTHHAEERFDAEIQYLVRRGFSVLDVNYRGSTGFGVGYRDAIKEDGWGGREQEDIAAGARMLIEQGVAEAGKIGVTGTSYGGYSAWFLITHEAPAVIAAAAPICGMTDLVVDYETTRPDLRPYSEEMLGGSPEQVPDRYHERSPINFVDRIQGKVLIVQGLRDPNVTPENVRQVVTRLDHEEIDYEVLTFEDEGHGIAKPANQATLYRRLADFFDQALGR